MERFQKAPLGNCFHVEGVDDCSGEQIFDERSEQLRIVVPVVQGAGAGKEIKTVPAVLTVERAAGRAVEDCVPGAAQIRINAQRPRAICRSGVVL